MIWQCYVLSWKHSSKVWPILKNESATWTRIIVGHFSYGPFPLCWAEQNIAFLSDLTNYICVKTWNMTPPLWLFEEHLGDSLQITVSKNVERNARILKTYLETGHICWQNFNSADICRQTFALPDQCFILKFWWMRQQLKKSCLNWNKTWQRYFHGDLNVYGAWRCLC